MLVLDILVRIMLVVGIIPAGISMAKDLKEFIKELD